MKPPQPAWSPPQTTFMHLVSGRSYEVVQSFVDYDRREHPVGETWQFHGHSFLPYDDGLSLFVSTEEGGLRQIRMQWRDEEQGPVIDALHRHVRAVDLHA